MNNETCDYRNKDLNRNNNFGKITVKVSMNTKDGEKMSGVKINLYRINGISPQLEYSKITDPNGVVIFENLTQGNYRVIEIIDKEIYEKPVYSSWNEVNISNYTRETVVNVINRKRKSDD